jgi:hypothetical protein
MKPVEIVKSVLLQEKGFTLLSKITLIAAVLPTFTGYC